MLRIFVIAESKKVAELCSELVQNGFACSIAGNGKKVIEQVIEQAPDLVLLETGGHSSLGELAQRVKRERNLPVIALVSKDRLDGLYGDPNIDDFVITPCDVTELVLRIKRLLYRISNTHSSELIKCDDLIIDLAKCEVSLEGRLVVLTFREYELLRFLAKSRGRVFSRQTLLNKVWGYDYYGGDRTVDVHIRRLRSKIEDAEHTFIETVRNIGYRFRKDV